MEGEGEGRWEGVMCVCIYMYVRGPRGERTVCVCEGGGGRGRCVRCKNNSVCIIMISKLLPFSNRRASPFVFLFLPPSTGDCSVEKS